MPPNGEVYGITGPLRMRVGRSYATEREVYGITGDQWSPLRNERERGKCVGAVIGRQSGKYMKKNEGEEWGMVDCFVNNIMILHINKICY